MEGHLVVYVFSGKWKRVCVGSVERHGISSEWKGEIENYWAALRTHLDFVVKNLKWDQSPWHCVFLQPDQKHWEKWEGTVLLPAWWCYQGFSIPYFEKYALKGSSALELREVQSTLQNKCFGQAIRWGVSCLSQFSWPLLLNIPRLLCFFLAFLCNQGSLSVSYEGELMCDTTPVL